MNDALFRRKLGELALGGNSLRRALILRRDFRRKIGKLIVHAAEGVVPGRVSAKHDRKECGGRDKLEIRFAHGVSVPVRVMEKPMFDSSAYALIGRSAFDTNGSPASARSYARSASRVAAMPDTAIFPSAAPLADGVMEMLVILMPARGAASTARTAALADGVLSSRAR